MPETTGRAPSLTTRPLRLADAVAVFELTRDAELHDTGHSLVELDDIRGDWSQPSYDLEEQSVGFFEDDELVAYGEVHRNRLEGYVRPESRGRGIGTSLFSWGIAKARELGYDRLGQTVPVTNTEALALFRRFGCELLWTSWILELPEGAAIGEAELPAGFRLRDFDEDRDARGVYQTVEDAFNEWPNRQPSTFEDWSARILGRADFEPWQIILVVHDADGDEQVVGACTRDRTRGCGLDRPDRRTTGRPQAWTRPRPARGRVCSGPESGRHDLAAQHGLTDRSARPLRTRRHDSGGDLRAPRTRARHRPARRDDVTSAFAVSDLAGSEPR